MIDHQEDREESRRETLGAHLQRTRRSQHKTLEEAAATTRIHVSTLTALEADNFAGLPAEVFTRGFIKLYASYLGLDPSETLQHYINQENVDPEKPADRPYRRDILDGASMAHPVSFFKGNRRTLSITLLLALLVGFYILGTVFKSVEQHPEDSATETEIAQSLVNEQAPARPELADQEVEPSQTPPAMAGNEMKVPEPRVPVRKPQEPAVLPEPSPAPLQVPSPGGITPPPRVKPSPPASPNPVMVPAPLPTEKPAATTTVNQPAPPGAPEPVVSLDSPAQAPRSQPFRPVTVKVATTVVDGTDTVTVAPLPAPPGAETYVLEARFRERSWVHAEVDDQPIREYNSQADVTRVWKATRQLVLKLDNAEAVDLTLNGAPLPLAGEPGEIVTIRIPQDLP